MPLTLGQGSLQSVTFGVGTNYRIADPGPQGIGGIEPKTVIVDLKSGDGGYAGPVRRAIRVITIPFIIVGTSESNAMDNFETLAAAFEDPGSDQTLELYLPGKHFSVSGRPWGLGDEDLGLLYQWTVTAQGTFMATDPTMTAL
jgi:hypothetical protein